ncbi:MAG TPA: hypothetical protein PKA27_11620 [Fimbriimonadaceae bacterium]|nr:hypothetical protein [Fimbriimonadaceae bacterium]
MSSKSNPALLVSFLVIAGVIAVVVLYPVFQAAKPISQRLSDLTRMKQIGVAAMIYAEDSGSCLPIAANWKAALSPYIKNEFVFKCEHLSNGVNAYGHVYERSAAGLNVMKTAEPEKQVMCFDGTNIVANAVGDYRTEIDFERGNGAAHVVFADAHVRKVAKGWLGN